MPGKLSPLLANLSIRTPNLHLQRSAGVAAYVRRVFPMLCPRKLLSMAETFNADLPSARSYQPREPR